ncbi:MAG: hypothetical protein DRQ42_05250 [Gammaproteobacteria bacterium]|nr:MAG: hypothetical protein DRQ42_05250 [Gammaproteobacteria bacterium]
MIKIKVNIAEAMVSTKGVDFFDMELPAKIALKLATRFKHLDIAIQPVYTRKKKIFKEHANIDKHGVPITVGGVAWKEGKEEKGEAFLKATARQNEEGNVLYYQSGIRWKDEEGPKLLEALTKSEIEIALPPIKFDPDQSSMTLGQAMTILPFLEIIDD